MRSFWSTDEVTENRCSAMCLYKPWWSHSNIGGSVAPLALSLLNYLYHEKIIFHPQR
jgi:hypothetical protein